MAGHTHAEAGHSAGHGAGHGHGHAHEHTIVPMRVLVIVLTFLLLATGFTVLAANIEILFARMFDVTVPQWVNAAVALSIAAVKSMIVAGYFMQLRYEKSPINSLIAVFTILVLTFFLGFTAIDMTQRDALYDYKAEQVVAGGTGGVSVPLNEFEVDPKTGESRRKYVAVEAGKSIAMAARERADKTIDSALAEGREITNKAYQMRLYIRHQEMVAAAHSKPLDEVQKGVMAKMEGYMAKHKAKFDVIAAKVAKSHGGHGGDHGGHGVANSADRARPGKGVTLPELMDAGAKEDGHGKSGGH
jgi:caa(3)-type oxidase subunit IV